MNQVSPGTNSSMMKHSFTKTDPGTHKISSIWGEGCISYCPSQASGTDILFHFPPLIDIVDSYTTSLSNFEKHAMIRWTQNIFCLKMNQ